MLRLDTTTRILTAQLAAAPATSQLAVAVSYSDKTATTYNGATQLSNTNGVTPVTIASSPAASTSRDIDSITIANIDTAPVTITVKYSDNGTLYTLFTTTLAVSATLLYTHANGWKVQTANSNYIIQRQSFIAGTDFIAGTTTSLTLTSTPGTFNSYEIHFDGVLQHQTEYALAGNVVTFVAAIPVGTLQVEVLNFAASGVIPTGGVTGGTGNSAFFENNNTITQSYTITAGNNAMTAGPVTINTGVTVTIPTGSNWAIIG